MPTTKTRPGAGGGKISTENRKREQLEKRRDESGRDENRKCFPYGRAKVVATKTADENPPVRNGLKDFCRKKKR
jgi:hypothetical protein